MPIADFQMPICVSLSEDQRIYPQITPITQSRSKSLVFILDNLCSRRNLRINTRQLEIRK